jgi:hypothetical protein
LTIDTNNRITNTGFSYDSAGSVLADGSFSYTWDAESELETGGQTGRFLILLSAH